MPCILGGMRITLADGNPQWCSDIGGDWTEEPGLIPNPDEAATLQQSTIGTSYPGPALQDPQKLSNLFSRPVGTSYSMGQGVQRSFTEPGLGYPNTDDFGRPLQSFKEGNTNFGVLRDRAVTKQNTDAFNNKGIHWNSMVDPSNPQDARSMEVLQQLQIKEDRDKKIAELGSYNIPNPMEQFRGGVRGPLSPSTSPDTLESLQQAQQKHVQDWADTDDFGNPLSTNFEGNTNFGLLRDRAVTKFSEDAYNERNRYGVGGARPDTIFMDGKKDSMGLLGAKPTVKTPWSESDVLPLSGTDSPVDGTDVNLGLITTSEAEERGVDMDLQNANGEKIYAGIKEFSDWVLPDQESIDFVSGFITDPGKRAAYIQYMKDNPGTSIIAAAGAVGAGKMLKKGWGVIKKSKWFKDRYRKTLVRNNKTTGKFESYSAGNGTLAGDAAKVIVGGVVVDKALNEGDGLGGALGTATENTVKTTTEPTAVTTTTPTTPTTVTTTKPTKPTTPTDGLISGKNTPANKPAIDAGQKGLLDATKTKGFWSTPIAGGAGAWDNRLFRLGEMMAYMGTPLSKRGDNPSKRWTSANTEASKLKQALSKARGIAGGKATTAQRALWKEMVKAQSQNLKDKYMADKGGFLGLFKMKKEEQERRATALAQNEMVIKYEMIGFNIEPTGANYIKFLELRSKGLI